MKKKGFVMVETIVMVAFLSFALLVVYKAFTATMELEKTRSTHNNTNYLYRTYTMKRFFEDNGISTHFATTTSATYGFKEIDCNSSSITNGAYCTMLKGANVLDIKKMYIFDVNSFAKFDYDAIEPTVSEYIRTLKNSTGGYRLVIWFNDNNIASLKLGSA